MDFKIDLRSYMRFFTESAAIDYMAANDLSQYSDRVSVVKVEPLAFIGGREIPKADRGPAFWAIKDKYQNYLRIDGRF